MSLKLTHSAVALLCLVGMLVPPASADEEPTTLPQIEVKMLGEPFSIPVSRDPSILAECQYVAVVRGAGVQFERVPFSMIINAPKELAPSRELRVFLAEQYGRRVLHYVNGRLWGPGPLVPMLGFPGMSTAGTGGVRFGPGDPGYRPGGMGPGTRVEPAAPGRTGPGGMPGGPGGPGFPGPGPSGGRFGGPGRPGGPGGPGSFGPSRRRAPAPPDATVRERFPERAVHEFRILAPTAERAEELARALVTAYNAHMQWLRQETQGRLKEQQEEHLPELVLALRKATADREKINERLKKCEPMPKQVYEELKTRDWTLRVETAGVRGRLEAARKIAAEAREHTPQKMAVAENVMVAAEIELAGLLEQRRMIDHLLRQFREYQEIRFRKSEADNALHAARNNMSGVEWEVKSLKTALEELLPFELAGPIRIHPIRWTKADQPSRLSPGMGSGGPGRPMGPGGHMPPGGPGGGR